MKRRLLTISEIICLLLVVVIIASMSACSATSTTTTTVAPSTTAAPGTAAPATIKIGAMTDETGPNSNTGTEVAWAWKDAVQQINNSGGIFIKEYNKKIPIELVERDQETNADKAVLGAQQMIQQGIVAALTSSEAYPSALPFFEKAHIVSLGNIQTIAAPFKQGYKYVFAYFPHSDDRANSLVALMNSFNPKPTTLGLFDAQMDFSTELADYSEAAAQAAGYKVVREKITLFTKDMSAQVLSMKNANVDVVFAPILMPDALTFWKTAQQLDFNPKAFLGFSGVGDNAWNETLGKDGEYAMGDEVYHWSFTFPGSQEFSARYAAAYKGVKGSSTAGASYASVQILADAIQRAGTLNPEAIRDALASTDMITIAGPAKFDSTGKSIYSSGVPWCQWQNGINELIYPDNVKTANVIYPMPTWSERK